ncbi:argininosuccinate lyase [Granulicella sp. dw_53]|uniref:argininosuccinate lyase n=1 Tax=Granulicella sp. dw_53 TaxID=2719792 RepID=UPI001BD55F77|nr:argininosuccinate lyase [Granulicella sp. dw_53]
MTLPVQPKSSFPAPIYRDTVLAQIFTDAKKYFLEPLLAIQYAHTLMLGRQGIMARREVAACLRALDGLDLEKIRGAVYDGSFEDLFFFMERELAAQCGVETAGKMHTARSRNDIDLTMYRMVMRERLAETMASLLEVRRQLVELAWTHRASLMPAYTHNQPAQPTTLGHYLMAILECFERDFERLREASVRVNRSPMGACAITTTGFPIDRYYVASMLGFEGLQMNSYGAIAAVDYLTESCSMLAVCMLNLGRLAQDFLQWSSVEFGYIRLSDGYVQISSIMPQKRNPVPLEHVRVLSSKAMTQAQAVVGSVHNTPFTDINDSEDDLQPMVYNAFEDAERGLKLLAGVLAEIEFLTDHMAACADANFLTVTELADTLVRETGMSFRTAHEIVSEAVKDLDGGYDAEKMAASVEYIMAADHREFEMPELDLLRRSLNAAHFVAVRKVPGGPALEALEPEILRSRALLDADALWLKKQTDGFEDARERVRSAARELLAESEDDVAG